MHNNTQGMITEPGNMVIYVAGYPAIMGLQPLYFRDSELARRARIPAESAQTKKLEDTLANRQRIKHRKNWRERNLACRHVRKFARLD
jgi:hypothetical protein